MLEKSEMEQLDKAWTVIKIIWGALLASLGVYVAVCEYMKDQLRPTTDFPLETMKLVLYGVSFFTLIVIHFIRRMMLKTAGSGLFSAFVQSPSVQHPTAGRYLSVVIVSMALCESIGIYGLVLFFMSKDSLVLYQFIIISAAAMLYFRPRKEELLQLAEDMNLQGGRRTN